MFVQIQAVKRDGFQGVWRAGRFWPSHEALRVEVTDNEPELATEDVFTDGKKSGTRKVPDRTKISKATLELLRKDGRVSVMGDGEISDTISKASLEAAKKSAADAGRRVAELEAENAGLKETIEALTARLTAAEGAAEGNEDHQSKSGKHRK